MNSYLRPTPNLTKVDYKEINRKLWNNKVDSHLASEFYNQQAFMDGESSLNSIELDLLSDVKGLKILHLQCHFGQDSLSLARMGAKVTGVDLSDKAIKTAQRLNQELGLDASFIACDIYDLPNHLKEDFDIVFTSYGTIGWLPDLDPWAAVINHFLKPRGKFVFVEFHPVVWMFDDDFTHIKYPYFNRGIIAETEEGTYADREADLQQEYVSWNHPLDEVLSALLKQGLGLQSFQEFDYSPYNCFNHTEQVGPKQWRIKNFGDKIPMVYALRASK